MREQHKIKYKTDKVQLESKRTNVIHLTNVGFRVIRVNWILNDSVRKIPHRVYKPATLLQLEESSWIKVQLPTIQHLEELKMSLITLLTHHQTHFIQTQRKLNETHQNSLGSSFQCMLWFREY